MNLDTTLEKLESSINASFPHHKFFEEFGTAEEGILSVYLSEEKRRAPYAEKYKDLGDPQATQRPVEHVRGLEKGCRELIDEFPIEKINATRTLASALEGAEVPEEVQKVLDALVKLEGFYNTLRSSLKAVRFIKREYCAIVSYAKEVAAEKGVDPSEAVRDRETRDEIGRRSYRTKANFLECARAVAHAQRTLFTLVTANLTDAESFVERGFALLDSEDFSVGDKFRFRDNKTREEGERCLQELQQKISEMPSKDRMENYLLDRFDWTRQEADRIFSSAPEKHL